MDLLEVYQDARCDEVMARARRLLALRAMIAGEVSQRAVAATLGVTQPAVSQQLKSSAELGDLHPQMLLEAAAPVLKALADRHGYRRLAVFGSVARQEVSATSDIDLLVEAPANPSSFDFVRFKGLIEQVLGRQIDLVDYGGLEPRVDDDIRRDAVLI